MTKGRSSCTQIMPLFAHPKNRVKKKLATDFPKTVQNASAGHTCPADTQSTTATAPRAPPVARKPLIQAPIAHD
jgi:hypothetical protein